MKEIVDNDQNRSNQFYYTFENKTNFELERRLPKNFLIDHN